MFAKHNTLSWIRTYTLLWYSLIRSTSLPLIIVVKWNATGFGTRKEPFIECSVISLLSSHDPFSKATWHQIHRTLGFYGRLVESRDQLDPIFQPLLHGYEVRSDTMGLTAGPILVPFEAGSSFCGTSSVVSFLCEVLERNGFAISFLHLGTILPLWAQQRRATVSLCAIVQTDPNWAVTGFRMTSCPSSAPLLAIIV